MNAPRTVLAVDTLGETDPVTGADTMMVKAERTLVQGSEPRKYRRLALAPQQMPPWNVPGAVRLRGRCVRDALRAHPGLAPVLDQLSQAPPGQVQPLFVKLSAGDAESIPWETLCDSSDEFLALDQRWPIGRVSEPLDGRSRPPAALTLPVRLLAVISAAGIAGQKKEWQALAKAIDDARAAGLPLRVRVLTGDPAVHAEVQADIAAGLADVTLGAVDTTASRVVQEIVAFSPQILHFFCHGHAGTHGADQAVELATGADFQSGAASGSVKLRTRQLTDMLEVLPNPWLLALNCCSGGAGSSELLSIAHQVVGAGFPAAVAMVEPVDASDAHEFARAFYRALFGEVQRAAATLDGGQATAEFEFARAMHAARSAICDLHDGDAPNARQWVLPVLYVRGVDPLRLQRGAAAAAPAAGAWGEGQQQRLRVTAEWLQSVRETLDEAGRREVMQRLLGGIPKSAWPDVNGEFR